MKINKNILKILIITAIIFFLASIIIKPILADPGNGNKDGNSNDPQQTEPKGSNNGNKENNQNKNNEGNGNKGQQQNQGGIEDNDGDQVDDKRERYQNRNMKIIGGKNKTQIRSEWQHNKTSDAFEVSFDIEDIPRFIFYYFPDKNNSEIKLSYIVTINKLFEYQDINRNGRYNKNDEIENSYLFNKTEFIDITYSQKNSSDGEEIIVINTGTEDGIFSIIFYVVGNFSKINNQTITPFEIKIDFIINDYPFIYDDTFLGIEINLETEHETNLETISFDMKQGYSKNESEINISSLKYNGFFSWVDYAFVDNEIKPVNATFSSEKEETIVGNITELSHIRQIYFSYPQGTNILHDPKIGVVSVSYLSYTESTVLNDITFVMDTIFADITTYVVSCILATILFIGVIFIRKRKLG